MEHHHPGVLALVFVTKPCRCYVWLGGWLVCVSQLYFGKLFSFNTTMTLHAIQYMKSNILSTHRLHTTPQILPVVFIWVFITKKDLALPDVRDCYFVYFCL